MTLSSINHALALRAAMNLFASTEPSRKLEATGRMHKIGRWPKSTEEARKECQAMRRALSEKARS